VNTSHDNMGVVSPARVVMPGPDRRRARRTIVLVAVCTALQMTSYGMIFPLFARKVGDFGDSVAVLAASLVAYSLGAAVAAPFMGVLADRFGRRPLILGSFVVFAGAFAGYYVAASSAVFIAVRGLAGALTAGLGPATMGLVADIAPADERARWIGIIGGGTSAGFIVGPVVGGLLYDRYGYGPPFAASIGIALLTLVVAFLAVPETHTREQRRRAALVQKRAGQLAPESEAAGSFTASLPHPVPAFGTLLLVSFSMVFAWFFIEPQLPFYVFDDLGWSTAQFGAVISCYGWAALTGSLTLGRSSDRFGRTPIIVIGLALHTAQYVGLMLTSAFWLLTAAFVVAGVGEALVNPAVSAAYLDITPDEHRSRAMGIKTAVGSLGSLLAPALVTMLAGGVTPQGVFTTAAALILVTALVVLMALRLPPRTGVARDLAWEASQERVMAARSVLHTVTVSAATARELRSHA
jgi:DHA1 family tetracycline resistance protein-like MFS transporter